MELVENKALNIIIQIAIALGLAGIIMFLIQEIVSGMINPAYTVFVVIADFIGVFALIGLIIWMFIPKFQTLVLNITYILGAAYVFLFTFAHFFTTIYVNNIIGPIGTGNILDDFIFTGVSFVGLLLLSIVTIGVIVVFSLRFTKREEIAIFEKFTILIWIVLIGIYDFTNFYFVRQTLTFGKALFVNFGITFLPGILEFILLLFAAILIILKFFTKTDKNVISILMLVLLNIVFVSYTISTVNYVGFNFTTGALYPSILGNHFFMIATVAIVICTFLIMMFKYPVKKTTTATNE
ncbi:MAG: hypothetical protein ACTSPK_10525 [Candidatus Heimdallarchaeota archaeon]